MKPVKPENRDDFAIAAPAWRVRRLRAHLVGIGAAGAAARRAGESRVVPDEFEHPAERRRWLAGWDQAAPAVSAEPKQPTARQLARLARWRTAAGRLSPSQGALRGNILEAVADEMLGARPLAHGAIAAAHRETMRRCREAGLPAPRASRYRKWLKLTGRTPALPTTHDPI